MNISRLWPLILLGILLAGCAANESQQLAFQTQVAATIYANQTAEVKIATSTPTPLPTAKPTRTPQATPTSTVAVTPTPAVAAVGTPFRLPREVISPANINQLTKLADWGEADGFQTSNWDRWNEVASPMVTHATYAANGRYLAISTPNEVVLFEALLHTVIQRIDINLPVASLAFSADGSLLAIGYPGFVELWQVQQGQLLRVLKLGNVDRVMSIAFSTDGHTLLMGVAHHTLFWPIEADKPQADIQHTLAIGDEERPLLVRALAVSPDGKHFAAGTSDGSLWIGSMAERSILFKVKDQAQAFGDIAFTPDGASIASVGDGLSLRRVSDGELLNKRTAGGSHLTISFDGTQLALLSQDEVTLYQLPGLTELHSFYVNPFTAGLAFSPDAEIMLTWGVDLRLETIYGATINVLGAKLAPVTYLTFSPDSNTLAARYANGIVRLWRVRDGVRQYGLDTGIQQGTEYNYFQLGYGTQVYNMAFSPDGQRLSMTQNGGLLRIHRSGDGKLENILQSKDCGGLSILAYSPDGEMLATNGYRDKKICLWQVSDGELLKTLKFEGDEVTSLTFSPSGDRLAAGTADGEIKLWETAQWKLLWSQPVQEGAIHGLAFSSDGRLMASAGADGSLRLRLAESGSHKAVFAACGGACLGLSFSPDGRLLAVSMAGYGDNRFYLVETDEAVEWDLGQTITGVAFSPDGMYLATGHEDGSISLWAIP